MKTTILTTALLIAVSSATHAQAGKYEKLEAPILDKIREIWTATADAAYVGRHRALLMRAVDEARVAGGSGETLESAESYLVAKQGESFEDGPEAAELLKKAIADVGAAVAPLLLAEPTPGESSDRYVDHLVRAITADPKNAKAVASFQKRALGVFAKKDWNSLRLYLRRAGFADPEGSKAGKYRAAEQALAQNGGLVVQGPDHLLQSYVVLPDGWNAKKTWPMFVAIVGANCAYTSMLEELIKAGKKKPYILVVMMTIGNGNELPLDKLPYPKTIMQRYVDMMRRPQRIDWDMLGMKSNLAEIRRRFNGDEKFFLTGYSGGGFVLYQWLLHASDQLIGACAGSANYWTYPERDMKKPEDGGCPVLIVTGSLDQAGQERIFPQSAEAAKKLQEFGFKSIDKRHLTGRDHEPFYELGLELLEKSLAASRKK